MNIVVVPEAADEFEDSVAHYDEKESGLGQRFRDEVDARIRWITANSDVPRMRPAGYRRVNLRVFPHYIAYLTLGVYHLDFGYRPWAPRTRVLD